jgi:hypothetical protein
MSMTTINLNIRRAMQRLDARDRPDSPAAVTTVLRASHEALLAFIRHANAELGQDSEACISRAELNLINGVYAELLDNFLPMAHTDQPLQALQIIERQKANQVHQELEELRRLTEHARALSEDAMRLAARASQLGDVLMEDYQNLIHP